MISPIPPAEIAAVLLAELLFGMLFNRLVEWAHFHRLWDVSISVTMGVAVTVVIPVIAWWRITLDFWLAAILLTACFASSGTPMIIGSMQRRAAESHKRRPWPTAAAQARDDALMDLNLLAEQIASKKVTDAQAVNGLHKVIGILKSV